jgi:hypothetical protein
MDHFAGLDVSVKETSVCIVDDTGRIIREVKVTSEPEALLPLLTNPTYHFKRVGLEAGPLSQWLFGALAEAGLPVICVETRHMRAVLKAQINKTDRNDARGIAQMMRAGLYRPVHVKTLCSQKTRILLTHRKLLQSKAIALDNDLRATLRNFGLKVGIVGRVKFAAPMDVLCIPKTYPLCDGGITKIDATVALLCFVFAILASPLKSRSRLEAENAALRHQLNILCRQRHVRVRLTNNDRWFFIQLYRWFPSIREVLTVVRPETLVRWHRARVFAAIGAGNRVRGEGAANRRRICAR